MNVIPRKDKDGRQLVHAGKLVWRLRWETVDPGTQERKYEYGTFYGNKTEAEAAWIDKEATIQKAGKTYTKPSKERTGNYLRTWLDGKKSDLRPATVESYERMLRVHVIPAVGAVPLADLTPRHVQGMIAGMRDEEPAPSPRTIAYARTVLRIALQDAVDLGLLPSNPVDRTNAPKQEPKQRGAFTLEQGQALFAVADATRMGPLLRFTFFSGMRRGEVLGLRWQDVDLDAATATVRQAQVVVKGKGVTQGTKTEAGIRTVPLVAPALEALRLQKDRQAFDRRAAVERWQDAGLVFTTAEGRALGPNNVSRDFRRLRDEAGRHMVRHGLRELREAVGLSQEKLAKAAHLDVATVAGIETGEIGRPSVETLDMLAVALGCALPALPFHALRHTAVSVLLGAGVELAMVSKVIGHKRYALTVDQYGHLTPEAGQKIAAQVDDFLAGQKGRKRAAREGSGY